MTYNTEFANDVVRTGATLFDEQNRALYVLIRAGRSDARERMIEGNLSLVLFIVDHFIGIAPQLDYLRDDMTSAGCVGLVKAVNKLRRDASVKKVTSYLSVAVRHEIRRFLSDETTIYVPQRSQQAARAQNSDIDQPVVVNNLPEYRRLGADQGVEEVDMRDMMETCCMCEEERILLRMREQGYTWTDVAEALRRSRSSTHDVGQTLRERITARLNSLR